MGRIVCDGVHPELDNRPEDAEYSVEPAGGGASDKARSGCY